MKFKDVVRHSIKAHYLNCSVQSWKILAWMKIQHTQVEEDVQQLEADGLYYKSKHDLEEGFSCVRISFPSLVSS